MGQGRPLFEQGVCSGSSITVIRCKPQATLLRIRRVNLGSDVRTSCQQPDALESCSTPKKIDSKPKSQAVGGGKLEKKHSKKRELRSHSSSRVLPKQDQVPGVCGRSSRRCP